MFIAQLLSSFTLIALTAVLVVYLGYLAMRAAVRVHMFDLDGEDAATPVPRIADLRGRHAA